MEATLSSKHQATIPKEVRLYLNLRPGDRFKFFLQPDGTVAILPRIPTARLKGTLPRGDKPVPVEDMTAAAAEGAAEHLGR